MSGNNFAVKEPAYTNIFSGTQVSWRGSKKINFIFPPNLQSLPRVRFLRLPANWTITEKLHSF